MAADQARASALDIEREQEALLRAKLARGGLKRKQPLLPKETKYFDSADWALAKQRGEQPTVSAEESLPPAPITSHRPVMRTSKLDD